MAAFGTLTLLLALVVATYAGAASFVGVRRGSARLIESGRYAAYALAAVLGLSSFALIYAFVSHDYSIKYVQHYSDASLPLFYQLSAYWGGLDGSILWWVFLLSVFAAIAIHVNRDRHRSLIPWVILVTSAVADFFLYVIVFHKNPFDTYLTEIPAVGQGLNPLLQNAYMATHPPSLYIGFVGMTIPYAFAIAALATGQLDDAWIAAVRRWTLIPWFFLSMGLTLGMLWAYEELGWGGFWAWDPVENAGFLPWLTATAFLHSVMVQERRGMLKVWNFTLVILTFFLTIFGTFMTRSGVVQSVHAFGQDTELAIIFGVFMVIILLTSFALVIWRLPELRARGGLESWRSREAAFVVNNWVLLLAAFFILFATMFPTLSEAVGGARITVGPPFFNKWMVPIGLILLFLTGVGPLLAWRKASTENLAVQFRVPVGLAVVTLVACLVAGLGESKSAVLCFGFCAFVVGSIGQDFLRATAVRRKNSGGDSFSALLGLVLRNRRRYGGYVVHIGIVVMFIGWAGQAYQLEGDAALAPGQTTRIGRYTVRFDRLSHEEDRQKEMITGEVAVLVDGKEIDRLRPARWYFHGHEGEPTTEVAIRRSPAEDLYLTLGNYDLAEGMGNLKLVVNPLVDWVWLGFLFLALGTGIALLPEAVLAPVAVRAAAVAAPGRAAGTAALLLFLLAALAPRPARADATEDRKWLEGNIMCLCGMGDGGCRHVLRDCGAECGHAPLERAKVKELLAAGKTREDVVQYFLDKYHDRGQIVLAAPIDKGFNRLAWLLPYGAGAFGAGLLVWGAVRMSRRAEVGPAEPVGPPPRPDIEDRLDEELDKLD